MVLSRNTLINENIVTPRLVNQQVLDYDAFCDYLAQGSTVTAADVSAVMKQLEKNLPLILALNAKVIVSPDGLVFRPTVRGSITQSQLQKKLLARKQELIEAGQSEEAAKIDTERELAASDLTTSDITASIVIDMPKKWESRFQQSVSFKRVNNTSVYESEGGEEGGGEGGGDDEGDEDDTFTLHLTAGTGGSVSPAGDSDHASGASVQITATPNSGWEFLKWSDGNMQNPRTIVMDENKTLQAQFQEE